jgi:hypothetical protein
MRISIQGSDGSSLCQIPALREGFAALGHEHTFEAAHPDTAFVFCGNSPFEQYLPLIGQKKIIFNVLDLPFHVPEIGDIIARLREQLPLASRVTTISKTVAAHLKEYCNVNAEVIYYPMKPVKHTGIKKYPGIRALLVGRVNDRNKRAAFAIQSLIRAGFNEDEIVVVGPENPFFGRYFGVCSDEVLNDLYNSTEYVMMTSKNEGIGLPAIESAICGAIPMICPDLSTFDEFWAESPLGLHYQHINSPNNMASLITSLEDNSTWKAEVKQDLLGYAALKFAPKFNAKAVATRIIDVFHQC